MVQQGLEHAESVAVVAEKAKARTGQVLKVGLVLGLVALVLVVVSRRRSAQDGRGGCRHELAPVPMTAVVTMVGTA